jgi:hypothetical protein
MGFARTGKNRSTFYHRPLERETHPDHRMLEQETATTFIPGSGIGVYSLRKSAERVCKLPAFSWFIVPWERWCVNWE